jgi:hypothetical protein
MRRVERYRKRSAQSRIGLGIAVNAFGTLFWTFVSLTLQDLQSRFHQ